jgi:MFS family permease
VNPEVRSEFAHSWRAVVATFVGMGLGVQGLSFYSFGVFITPLAKSFGWSLSAVASWFLFVSIGKMIFQPFVGLLADRIGAVRTIVVAIPLYAVMLGSVALLTGGVWIFYAIAFTAGVVGTGLSQVTYARVITSRFNAGRGSALGIMSAGVALSSIVGPRLMQIIIDSRGWRTGFLFLAGTTLVAWPVMGRWLKIRDPGTAKKLGGQVPGYELLDVIRRPPFWILCVGFLLSCVALGTAASLVPFFTHNGISRANAANLMGLFGVSSLVGRIVFGYAIDRFHVASAFAFTTFLQSCTMVMLWVVRTDYAVMTIIVLGFSIGGEVACGSYAVARYFGLRAFGQIFGWLYIPCAIGAGIAPPIFNWLFELTGNYDRSFQVFAALGFVAAALFASLSRYPFFNQAAQQGSAPTGAAAQHADIPLPPFQERRV